MQEAPLLQNEHRMVRVDGAAGAFSVPAEEGFDRAQGVLMRAELGKLLWARQFDRAAFLAERRREAEKELKMACSAHRKRVLAAKRESTF